MKPTNLILVAIVIDFGPRQMETGELIIYTSADPVLQIAAHEDIIPLDELYRICEYARSIGTSALLGRIIARPYVGNLETSHRAANRRLTWLFHHCANCGQVERKRASVLMQLVRSTISSTGWYQPRYRPQQIKQPWYGYLD